MISRAHKAFPMIRSVFSCVRNSEMSGMVYRNRDKLIASKYSELLMKSQISLSLSIFIQPNNTSTQDGIKHSDEIFSIYLIDMIYCIILRLSSKIKLC